MTVVSAGGHPASVTGPHTHPRPTGDLAPRRGTWGALGCRARLEPALTQPGVAQPIQHAATPRNHTRWQVTAAGRGNGVSNHGALWAPPTPPYPNKPRAPQAPRPGPEARGRQETLGSPPENTSTGSGRRTNYPRDYLLRSLPTGGGLLTGRTPGDILRKNGDRPMRPPHKIRQQREKLPAPVWCSSGAPCLSPTRTVVTRRWRQQHVLGCEPITVGRQGN